MKEGTTLLAIGAAYGGDLGDVGTGVGGSAADRAIRNDVSVDASIGLYFFEPRVLAVGDLSKAMKRNVSSSILRR